MEQDKYFWEPALISLLQKNVKLTINNKQYRKGRLLLYRLHNFHIELTLEKSPDVLKRFEIPIPFSIEEWDDGNVYFDYRLKSLASGDDTLVDLLSSIPRDERNKFYDNILAFMVI